MIVVSDDEYIGLIEDETPIEFKVLPYRAFLLLSAIQLAYVHPDVDDGLKATWLDIGRRLQLGIEGSHPAFMVLMEAGWDRDSDVLVRG